MAAYPTTRERIIETAARLTAELGWAQVTMGRLAAEVGVSRQTVHNEVKTRTGLAQAMVEHELAQFLALVGEAFDTAQDDAVEAIRLSAVAVLEHARDNTLLHAVVSATHGADTELLPLLTTNSEVLLSAAKDVVRERIAAFDLPLPPERRDAAIDVVVRVVLSHVMQPSAEPAETADAIAWIAGRVLA